MTAIPPNPEHSEAQFQQWLERMPEMHLGETATISIPLTLHLHDWTLLIQAAAREGFTINEALRHLLAHDGAGMIQEWANRGPVKVDDDDTDGDEWKGVGQ